MDFTTFNGLTISGASDEYIRFLQGRESFVLEYCKIHTLDPNALTIDQILEIRKQDGWINPLYA